MKRLGNILDFLAIRGILANVRSVKELTWPWQQALVFLNSTVALAKAFQSTFWYFRLGTSLAWQDWLPCSLKLPPFPLTSPRHGFSFRCMDSVWQESFMLQLKPLELLIALVYFMLLAAIACCYIYRGKLVSQARNTTSEAWRLISSRSVISSSRLRHLLLVFFTPHKSIHSLYTCMDACSITS